VSPPIGPPADQNDLHARAQDELASLALGEQVDGVVADHVRGCPLCLRELEAYRHVAGLARAGSPVEGATAPPPAVWDAVLAELGAQAPSAAPVALIAPRPPRWRRVALLAAAVVAIAGAGIGGWAIGHTSSTGTPDRTATAVLAAQPGTTSNVHGTAVVHPSSLGYTLNVTSDGLPAGDGYYEVWLYNPSINQMVAVGTLGAGGRGAFTVPAGIDLGAYHVVDVSAQRYDGNNRHERSVLRGPLNR
jgi:hypothetical protein